MAELTFSEALRLGGVPTYISLTFGIMIIALIISGFVTVVPAGFPEIAILQSQGYQYINPLANRVGKTRYLDQPQMKK